MTQTNESEPKQAAGECCSGLEGFLEPRFFKALCDATRVGLLSRIAEENRPCTVSEIAEWCPVDISVVSRHLSVLREAGILESEKRGKEVRYSVRYEALVKTLRTLADAIEACCPPGTQPEHDNT